MVTAEAAVVLPVIAAFALVLLWLLSVGVAQVRTVDAARDAARAMARGVDREAAIDQAQRTAPEGSVVTVDHRDDLVAVTVRLDAEPPVWLLVPLPSIEVGSRSLVEVEPDGR